MVVQTFYRLEARGAGCSWRVGVERLWKLLVGG